MIFKRNKTPEKPGLLIVDDEVSYMEMLKGYLGQRNIDVVCAASSEEALMRMRKHRFKVVIMDYQMPHVKGDDLIGKLQHIHPVARFIVITGVPEGEAEQAFRGTGYYAFLPKANLALERLLILVQRAFQD